MNAVECCLIYFFNDDLPTLHCAPKTWAYETTVQGWMNHSSAEEWLICPLLRAFALMFSWNRLGHTFFNEKSATKSISTRIYTSSWMRQQQVQFYFTIPAWVSKHSISSDHGATVAVSHDHGPDASVKKSKLFWRSWESLWSFFHCFCQSLYLQQQLLELPSCQHARWMWLGAVRDILLPQVSTRCIMSEPRAHVRHRTRLKSWKLL